MRMTNENDIFFAEYFGTFELRQGEIVLSQESLRSRQMTKLLQILIYYRGKSRTAPDLMDMLWPDTVDNPAHALSNLVYRLRKSLRSLWPDQELILSKNGMFFWNPEIPVETDVSIFTACMDRLRDDADAPCNIMLLEEMTRQYKGKYLSDHSEDPYIVARQAYYHSCYIQTVKRLMEAYEAQHAYDEMDLICQRAILIDPWEESFHCGQMQAYIGRNRFWQAEQYYYETVRRFQKELGEISLVHLQNAYRKMQNRIHVRETDLSRVLAEMRDQHRKRQALYCDYDFFQKLYVLQGRLKERDHIPVTIVLLSLYQDAPLPGEKLRTAMDQLKGILLSSLRYGDIIAGYSASQYLLMLSGCAVGHVDIVMDRIRTDFYKECKFRRLVLQHSAREIT